MAATVDEMLRDFWEQCCREFAADHGMTYEQVVEKLQRGEAAVQINATIETGERNELAD